MRASCNRLPLGMPYVSSYAVTRWEKSGSDWHFLSCALKGGIPRRRSGRQRCERHHVQARSKRRSARAAVVLPGGHGEASAEVGQERRRESVPCFLTSASHPC